MELYAILEELSIAPLSSEDIRRVKNLFKRIRVRSPAAFSKRNPTLLVDEKWVHYTRRVSEVQPHDGEAITPSLWRLAQGYCLDAEIITSYLKLLRDSNPRIPIAEVQKLQANVVQIMTDIIARPGNDGYFAVLYPDTIHWFDSEPNKLSPLQPTPGKILRDYNGPKHDSERPQDSGLFMLSGIRRVSSGNVNFSQQEAQEIVSTFRSRILVELLSQNLEPSSEDFEALLQREHETSQQRCGENSLFFDEAMAGMGLSPQEPDTPDRYTLERFTPGMHDLPTALLRTTADSQGLPEYCKTILTILYNAVTSIRHFSASYSTDITVLWSSIKNGTLVSEFHKRYNGILLYDKLEQCKGMDPMSLEAAHNINRAGFQDLWNIQPWCKFWRDLCDLQEDQGSAKYTLLCLMPESHSLDVHNYAEILKIKDRLLDPNDKLANHLKEAQSLCEAIIELRLPKDSLMIDSYKYRAHEPLTPAMYGAFLSLNPRPKVPLRRMPGQQNVWQR
ncbi:hypothetical protein BX600DRAFT_440228 [Xylariales sp. PMI_506]|nr:hypothetical protein BX600DRAFT_440228 [Xylariales sp. PMI_506]